jgi:hypothetical protein
MTTGTTTRKIEVFRPGTFQPMSGEALTFTADDLRAIAQSYDTAAHPAPVVVGHPKTDDPAYGWIKSFAFDEESQKLIAEIGEIDPAFVDAVQAGRYKKVSMAFYRPDTPNNPKPGGYYPKHIGFLGAAAPAVSGLRPAAFVAVDEAALATFEFADATALREAATLFRSLREWIIEKFDLETADKALPGWTIQWISDAADREPRASPNFSAPSFTAPSFSAPALVPVAALPTITPKLETPKMTQATDAQLAEREARVATRERELNEAAHASFADGLVREGRLLPVNKERVVALLNSLSIGDKMDVSFAEGDATVTKGAVDTLKELLAKQPVAVDFSAVDVGGAVSLAEFSVEPGQSVDRTSLELHSKAVAYQRSHPATDYVTAIRAVSN